MPPRRPVRAPTHMRVAPPALIALAALLLGPRADATVRIGRLAPPLIVRELDGREFDLARERGHVVLVNFWATWCSPCRAEMPLLEAFYRRYRGRGLVVLALSIDTPAGAVRARRIMRKFTYPAALASAARVDGFGEPQAVPMTYVIGAHGIVRARWVGGLTSLSRRRLEQRVLPLLAALKH